MVDNGADINDVRFITETPLNSAIKSGFKEAEALIRSLGGVNYTKIIEIDDVNLSLKSIPSHFLQRMYLLSQFPSARQNIWFTTCFKNFDYYKTDEGT